MVKGGVTCYGCDWDYTEGYWLEIAGEEPIFYCRECAEKANLIGALGVYEHGPNTVVDVVVEDNTEPVERFQLVVPVGDPKTAVQIAIDEVEARGYNVMPNDQGGCNKYIEDYIAITVTPSE